MGSEALAPGLDPFAASFEVSAFPGRWDRHRAFPPELEPLPHVTGEALQTAGWWHPGSDVACGGGLVVGCDGGPLISTIQCARELSERSTVSPTSFLYALASTTTSVLGLLFGLGDYQATVVQGGLSGGLALHHALDLLTLERLDRVLVAVLSVAGRAQLAALTGSQSDGVDEVRLAVAMCFERGDRAVGGTSVVIEVGAAGVGYRENGGSVSPLPESCRHLGAAVLVELAHWLERSPEMSRRFHHKDRLLGDELGISVARM